MGTLTTRPYAPTDAAALADLLNALETRAGGHPGWTAVELGPMLDSTVRDTAADSRMAWTADGTLAAMAIVSTPPVNGFRVDLWGGVHPDWQGRGLGRELFDWQLDRSAEIHQATAPDVAWQAHATTLVADEPARRLFRRFGLTPARYWFEMSAPTADPPALALPDGLRVVGYDPAREDAVYAAHMEAFTDHWGYQRRERADWLAMTVRSAGFRPEFSVLALDGEEIAGYVLSYRYGDPRCVYIGAVGVRRPWRRRGIAAALLARVLRAAARAGYDRANLGVDADSPTGAVGVYERVGFGVDHRAVTYSMSLPR